MEGVASRTTDEIERIVRRLVAMALMHESGPCGEDTDHRRALVFACQGLEIVWTRGGGIVRALEAVSVASGKTGVESVRTAIKQIPFTTRIAVADKGEQAFWFEFEMSVGNAPAVEAWAEANGGDLQ